MADDRKVQCPHCDHVFSIDPSNPPEVCPECSLAPDAEPPQPSAEGAGVGDTEPANQVDQRASEPEEERAGFGQRMWDWFTSPEGAKGYAIRGFLVLVVLALIASAFSPGDTASIDGAENVEPTASFTYDCTDLRCSFDASPSTDSDGQINHYQWHLGDGTTATGRTLDHTYTTAGTYTVELTVTDNRSASDTQTHGLTVEGPIKTLFSDSISTGLTSAVSEDGSRIAFGLDDGNVMLFDDQGTSNHLGMSSSSSVSHLTVSQSHNQINLAWMDADTFGAVTLTGDTKWGYNYPGLWSVDWNANRTITAAVSNPSEGTGGVGYGVNGDVQWTNEFDNASGWSVAVSDQGDYVAVGTDEYWDGFEFTGTPSVRMYDSQGTLTWNHETETAVLSVGVDTAQGIVVAGTDGGNLLAFDLDGQLLWSDSDHGGWIHLSEDGATVVTQNLGEVVAFDTDGNELWRAEAEGLFVGEKLHLSDDGSKVLAVARTSGNATLVDAGEVLWTQSYEGPIGGDLSEDGSTWSIIMQDNEEGESQVFAYRDTR